MSEIISVKKFVKSKPPINSTQKTFNRLKKQIESLQNELKEVQQKLDQALDFYIKKIKPKEKLAFIQEQERLKLLYGYYKDPKILSKKQKTTLKELMLEEIDELGEIGDILQINPELKAIISDLTDEDFNQAITEELDEVKEELQNFFRLQGLDLDISKIDFTNEETIKHTASEAFQEAIKDGNFNSYEEESSARPKQKTKKQQAKEIEKQKIETLQKKGLSSIYKQLAKSFHPDLEQDPTQKIEKEKLMKKLTCAYENNDLHTLLALEMEWINQSNQQQIQNTDQLKIYNSILKEQVEEIKDNITMSIMNPKYYPINSYLEEIIESRANVLQQKYSELNQYTKYLTEINHALQAKDGKDQVKSIIKEYKEYKEDKENDEDLKDIFNLLFN